MDQEGNRTEAAELTGYGGDVGKVIEALAKAQAAFDPIKRTRSGQQGNRRFQYAPLDEIHRAVRPALAQQGLAVTSYLLPVRGALCVVTELRLGDGFLRSCYPLTQGLTTQDRGKEVTYARRYNLNALLDLAADEDADDGGMLGGDDDAEREARRKEAEARLADMKKAGKLVSANDGKPIAPGETADPATRGKGKAEPAPDDDNLPMGGDLDGIAPALAAIMKRDGITRKQLEAYYVTKGHLPEGMSADKLPADYVAGLIKPANWAKAVGFIKENK
jgi:hypothetical protein